MLVLILVMYLISFVIIKLSIIKARKNAKFRELIFANDYNNKEVDSGFLIFATCIFLIPFANIGFSFLLLVYYIFYLVINSKYKIF